MPQSTARILVWDLPVRAVHWLMVALIAFSWWSGENRFMDYHRYSGYALLGVLLFRIYWGFAGSESARFAMFLRSPRVTLRYLAGRWRQDEPAVPGHNPLGAWSVLAMLILILAQVTLGLFSVDVDGIESGPLSFYVSFDVGRKFAKLHGQVFDGLLVFIGVHVAAILFYLLFKQRNLLGAMVTGSKRQVTEQELSLRTAPVWKFWLGVALAAIVAGVIVKL